MQWTRVTLPEVFEEFEVVYIFLLLFSFQYHCQLVTGQLKQKSGGGAGISACPACLLLLILGESELVS